MAPVTLHAVPSPKVGELLRDCLIHATQATDIARLMVDKFHRADFPVNCLDIFDAITASLSERGVVDKSFLAERVGWGTLAELTERTCSFELQDTYSVVRQILRDRKQQDAIQAIREGDYSKALATIGRITVSDPEEAASIGRITEATIGTFMQTVERNSKKELLGLRTGIRGLDALTLGLVPTWTWGIGAPTSAGKTQLACQIVNEAILQGGVILYVSLEMGTDWILSRILGANRGINPTDIYMGKTPSELTGTLEGVLSLYGDSPLYVRDNVTELSGIEKAARAVRNREGRLDLVVVDFIQNVAVHGVHQILERQATAATRLQALARETGACVIVLSQLSNEAVREEGKGILSFRYNAELAHAGDVAITMHPDTNGKTAMLVRKNRSGRTGAITLKWSGNFSRFEETT
jgi:replicative DNA helicase